MSDRSPPTIDAAAALRWASRATGAPPWLHEEVGRRMEERLQWIKLQPRAWVDWEPARGGLQAHAAVARRYPKAQCFVVEPVAGRARAAAAAIGKPWWSPSRWLGPQPSFAAPAASSVQMVWANMALHTASDPQALISRWRDALGVDGFLMFSCLGPDTLRELRALYQSLGWPPPAHEFTDMHDWGDMLVDAGFAEPVMDMEHITLTFDRPERLLDELRELGRNLHSGRFQGLRGRRWRERLLSALAARQATMPAPRLALTFEIIYGHAMKARPRAPMAGETVLSLDDMRELLRRRKSPSGNGP